MRSGSKAPWLGKIGLGTVQFGVDYGISNSEGRTPPEEVRKVLSRASEAGITVLDTAPAYGESERVLGSYPLRESGFKIVTKSPKFGSGTGASRARELSESLAASLSSLGIPRAYGLLFHRPSDLAGAGGAELIAEARRCREMGLVEKIGVSVYGSEEIDAVMDTLRPDLVQVPVNVFDQRLLRSGHLKALKSCGVEVHARSAFLQGLLLMEPESLPAHLERARRPLEAFRDFARGKSLAPLEVALGFVLGLPEVDTVLCGVNTSAQLDAICSGAVPLEAEALEGFALDDVSLLNPSAWGTGK